VVAVYSVWREKRKAPKRKRMKTLTNQHVCHYKVYQILRENKLCLYYHHFKEGWQNKKNVPWGNNCPQVKLLRWRRKSSPAHNLLDKHIQSHVLFQDEPMWLEGLDKLRCSSPNSLLLALYRHPSNRWTIHLELEWVPISIWSKLFYLD